MRRLRGEDGSILPLIIGGCALALALILGVATATSLYLERKRLLTIADGAALVAAQAFDLTQSARPNAAGVVSPVLTNASVLAGARVYLASAATSSGETVSLISATSPDSRTASVTVASHWQPPVVSYFFPGGFELQAQSSARSVFAD